MTDLPYQAEYAKSGRASCKGCKNKIDAGTLRIAVMVQSAFFDGKQPNWYHDSCFFTKQRPKSTNDIANFNILRQADQEKVKKNIESNTGIVEPIVKGKGKSKGTKRANDPNTGALKDFAVEYSKSSRATCRLCEIKICKDEVRICKVMFDTEIGAKYGGQPYWYHVKCFAQERNTLLYFAGGEHLPGFDKLTKEDKKIVKDEIKSMSSDEVPVKKLKEEPKDEKDMQDDKEKEKKIKSQNKLYFKYRDALSEYSKSDLQVLLNANAQEVPPGKDECLKLLADFMAFGKLERCPECGTGQLVLDNFGYKCTGSISEWTKCSYVTQNPDRKPMIVPENFKDSSAFKKFKPKVAVRLFEAALPPTTIIIKSEKTENVKKDIPIPPMKNLEFFIYGKHMKQSKEEIKHRILKLGGRVPAKLNDTIAAVVSSKKDYEANNKKFQEFESKQIEVVDESFLDLINPETGSIAKTIELIKEHNIATWGSDPAKRIPQDVIDGKSLPKSGSMYVSTSKSGVTKLKVKGGTAVDPASGLEDIAHVYTDRDGTKYTVVLGKTDVVAKKNSFYKLQVLEDDNKKKFWLFTSWGRIGTTIGGKKVEECSTLNKAIEGFKNKYEEKTENYWEMRDEFVKMPNCYYPIEVDYADNESNSAPLKEDSKCKLAKQVQQLIMKIFDINIMKKTLLEFELDTEKMPLGKLSKKQIMSGYKVLSELLKYIEKGQASQTKIIDATNRFYTLIPHDFGVNNPPLLNELEIIKTKTAMLDSLLEIEIAYSLLKSDSDESTSPIEAHYMKLKAEIAPLEKESPEFQLILEYVKNTHAETHAHYSLDVEEVFKVVREGEDKRYKPFKKMHNRRLLWHGSRITNFAGILSQGLRIAPPEAPVTGYMFGKGIYFADMVSKSANYCCTNKTNPTGIMLLCEVALGEMKECHRAENVKLPPGKHSAWGVGRTMPDPKQDKVLDDGTIVPIGKPITKTVDTSLLYNEFIVYDVAQVNVKYLLQMKFNFKY